MAERVDYYIIKKGDSYTVLNKEGKKYEGDIPPGSHVVYDLNEITTTSGMTRDEIITELTTDAPRMRRRLSDQVIFNDLPQEQKQWVTLIQEGGDYKFETADGHKFGIDTELLDVTGIKRKGAIDQFILTYETFKTWNEDNRREWFISGFDPTRAGAGAGAGAGTKKKRRVTGESESKLDPMDSTAKIFKAPTDMPGAPAGLEAQTVDTDPDATYPVMVLSATKVASAGVLIKNDEITTLLESTTVDIRDGR